MVARIIFRVDPDFARKRRQFRSAGVERAWLEASAGMQRAQVRVERAVVGGQGAVPRAAAARGVGRGLRVASVAANADNSRHIRRDQRAHALDRIPTDRNHDTQGRAVA